MSKIDLTFLLNKHYISDQALIEISDAIIKDNLVIKYSYIPENLNNISSALIYDAQLSWELDYGEQSNMYMLHLHALEPVSYLLLAYQKSKDKKYLDKAIDITFDWYEHEKVSDHFYLWYRHCVADRAIVLSYLYQLIKKNDDNKQKLIKMITKHKHYLIQHKNYTLHNHGTLVDMGLLAIAIVTDDESTVRISKDRLSNNFIETFTNNMICVENSISYSIYNIELFVKVEKYLLNPIGLTINSKFDKNMEQALDFLNIIKKNDDSFPNLGDGEKLELDYIKKSSINLFYPDHQLFIKKQVDVFNVYPDEGYIIIKNSNDYLFITAGDIKKNHKHADDLSFILSYDKKDVFVDSGIHSYNTDKINEYQKSSLAHNSIVINGNSYNYVNTDKSKIRITESEDKADYYFISMINKSYSYGNIVRQIYVLKEDFSIIIFDKIKSVHPVLATQLFNLSPDIPDYCKIELDKNSFKISGNLNTSVSATSDVFAEFINGFNPLNVDAIYSEKFHHKVPTYKITLNQYKQNPSILTLISKTDDNKNEILNEGVYHYEFQLTSKEKTLKIEKHNLNYEWTDDKNYHLELVANNNVVKGATIGKCFKEQEYSWDILIGSKKIDNIWYQDSNEFKYSFREKGNFRIRCYIRDKDDHSKKHTFLHDKTIVIH